MCEKQKNCGLYNYLIENGKLAVGTNCPKPNPKDCPRYQFHNGKDVEQARRVFGVENVYTHKLPLSREEMLM